MKPTYNNNYKRCIFPLFIVVSITLASCKKFVEVPPPPNLIVTSQVFADSLDANSAVLGLYISMIQNSTLLSSFNGGFTIYSGLSSDELYSTRNIGNENQIYANAVLSTNTTVSNFWGNIYAAIYKANAIIEGLSSSNGVSVAAKNQLTGEARFFRAFCYFNLVNLYGSVPLITTTNYGISSVMGRTSIDSVYQQIISDLTSAQSLLSSKYPTAGRVRPNKSAATALLARVFLYRKQWTNAENVASQIINDSITYRLVPLNNVFLSTIVTPSNTEAIWQIIPMQQGFETAEGQFFVPTGSAKPKYGINTFLLNAFEPGDQRKVLNNWINAKTIGTTTYYYPFKYKLINDGNTAPKENYMILRLGEQFLIRAEARAQQGTDLTGAASDLNIIRSRAGLPPTTASTQPDLLAAVYHERQVELFCEWGHRWFDLKRTGNIDLVMGTGGVCGSKGGTWSTNWQLYPIGLTDLNQNSNLTQNPGY